MVSHALLTLPYCAQLKIAHINLLPNIQRNLIYLTSFGNELFIEAQNFRA